MTEQWTCPNCKRKDEENRRLVRTMRDWFIGMALQGAAVESSDEAGVIVQRAVRIAEHAMRMRGKP